MEFGPIIPMNRPAPGKLVNTGLLGKFVDGTNGNRRLFHHGQIERGHIRGAIVPVRLTSIVASGKYEGKIFTGGLRTDLDTAITDTQLGTESSDPDSIVWNVPEAGGGAALVVGDDSPPVMCKVMDIDSDGRVVLVVLSSPTGAAANMLLAKITSNKSAPDYEKYNGMIRAADGTFPIDDDALIINSPFETVGNGWRLAINQEVVCVDTGLLTGDTPPRRIVRTQNARAITTPIAVIPSGTGLTLDLTQWDRDTAVTGPPVTYSGAVRVVAPFRLAWDGASTPPKWRGIARQMYHDANGNLFHIGPEEFTDSQDFTAGCGG